MGKFKNLQTSERKQIYPIWWGCYPRHFALSKSLTLILQNHAHPHHHQQHKKHHKLDWAQDHGRFISFSPPTPPSKPTLASPPIFLAGTFTDSCLFQEKKKMKFLFILKGYLINLLKVVIWVGLSLFSSYAQMGFFFSQYICLIGYKSMQMCLVL